MKTILVQFGDNKRSRLYKNRNFERNQRFPWLLEARLKVRNDLDLRGLSGLESSKKVQFREVSQFYQTQKSTQIYHALCFLLSSLWLPMTTWWQRRLRSLIGWWKNHDWARGVSQIPCYLVRAAHQLKWTNTSVDLTETLTWKLKKGFQRPHKVHASVPNTQSTKKISLFLLER